MRAMSVLEGEKVAPLSKSERDETRKKHAHAAIDQ